MNITNRKMDNQNIQNVGIYQGAGGKIAVGNDLTININNSSPAGKSTAVSKTPFRFNIPTPTQHFKGRRKTLEAVRDYFKNLPLQTVDCWERIVAIVGLGGMGKTETAYKFAAEFQDTFPNVAWINAETENSALTSFLGLAKYLNLVHISQKEADLDLVRKVYRHIDQEDYGCVLFIFDNAIRLNSGQEEFGIYEYLPTDSFTNKRFPNILITTQTHDWERRIETIQVDELSAEESLEFFRSTFQIKSAECDVLFTDLHDLLEGYPLAMNLAASQMDYNPNRGSVHRLKEQIHSYIGKLKKEQSKILNEKMNRAWPTKYHKTLLNVWQLTFERIQQEEDGHDALELLQLMSFCNVPLWLYEVTQILIQSSDCPYLSMTELKFRLKRLLRVLERFYTVRILYVSIDNETGFSCELGIHRLVQLVVRQQVVSSKTFERVLIYFARNYKNNPFKRLSVEEAIRKHELSHRALTYMGVVACHGSPAAREIVQTREPETGAAAILWRLYYLDRGRTTLSENAIQVLRELTGLTKSEEHLEDRCFFGDLTIRLLTDDKYFEYTSDDGTKVPGYFNLDALDNVKELTAELILNVSCVQFSTCNNCEVKREGQDQRLTVIAAKLTKAFVRADALVSRLTADVIAETWLTLFARMRYYVTTTHWPNFIPEFWRAIYETFHSPDVSQSRIGALRKRLWERGIAKELSQILDFLSTCYNRNCAYYDRPFLLQLMGALTDVMDLRDEGVQQVLSSFCKKITTIECGSRFSSFDHWKVRDVWIVVTVDWCSVWIKLFLVYDDPPSHKLLESHLSRLEFLDWMERSPKFTRFGEPYFRDAVALIPEEYRSEYIPQFIQKFSSSDIKVIQTLRDVCLRVMEDNVPLDIVVSPPVPEGHAPFISRNQGTPISCWIELLVNLFKKLAPYLTFMQGIRNGYMRPLKFKKKLPL